MKKFLASLLLLLALPLQTLALSNSAITPLFKPATLVRNGVRIPVKSKNDADALFAKGFKLELVAPPILGFAPTTGYSERLTQSITNSATTIYVSSVLDRDGLALPLSSTNKGYFTLESGAAREEAIVCTGVNTSTIALTGCTRGLLATGSSESGTGLKYSHNAGSKIIMTNIAQFYGNFLDLINNQTADGIKTFTSSPIVPTPTTATQVANKSYVDGVAMSGGANASTSTKGISYLSSDPASSTNPIALNSEEVAVTSGASKVPRANGSGKIDPAYIDGSGNYTFSGNNTYSGTGTFSGVNTFSNTNTFNGTTNFSTTTFSVFPTFPGTSFFKLAGVNSNAISTTSIALTDALTVSNLSISSTTPFQITANIGTASVAQSRSCYFGLKFNSTQVVTSTPYNEFLGGSNDRETQLTLNAFIPVRTQSRPGYLDLKGWGNTVFTTTSTTKYFTNAVMPTATITSISLGLYTSNVNASCRASDLTVYTYPTQ